MLIQHLLRLAVPVGYRYQTPHRSCAAPSALPAGVIWNVAFLYHKDAAYGCRAVQVAVTPLCHNTCVAGLMKVSALAWESQSSTEKVGAGGNFAELANSQHDK